MTNTLDTVTVHGTYVLPLPNKGVNELAGCYNFVEGILLRPEHGSCFSAVLLRPSRRAGTSALHGAPRAHSEPHEASSRLAQKRILEGHRSGRELARPAWSPPQHHHCHWPAAHRRRRNHLRDGTYHDGRL